MYILLKVVALLAVTSGSSAAEYLCNYEPGVLDCTGAGLTGPPPGYWPDVVWLLLGDNPIKQFSKNSLTGFPNVQYLFAPRLKLTELDLEELSTLTKLKDLNLELSNIETIKPLSQEGWDSLQSIFIYGNRITSFDPDVLRLAPNLLQLSMNENPIVVQPGQPVVNHPNLEQLWIGQGSSFGNVGSALLSGLPKLKYVTLNDANITSVNRTFASNPLLQRVLLDGNRITRVTSGTFASGGVLNYLSLDNNPLIRLDTSAVNAAMASGGFISVANTPLACDCLYEALSWWSLTKGVEVDASCGDQGGCSFARMRSQRENKLSKEEILGINKHPKPSP